MKNKKQKRQTMLIPVRYLIVGGILAAFILCLFLTPRTIRLRSDFSGVEFVYEDESITEVIINGAVPYGLILSSYEENVIRDAEGRVVEEIRTYAIEAGLSLRLGTGMKINIETSEKMVYTYILNFKDKEVTIINGRVVE